jgi:hypothetical protein
MNSTWTSVGLDPTGWKAEPGGRYHHGDAGPWYDVSLPGWWHRLTHRCTPHSVGIYGWAVMLRCVCGAVREGTTNPDTHAVTRPGEHLVVARMAEGWKNRNSRYRGTALFYHPQVRPLETART